jgi:hypothetical protein
MSASAALPFRRRIIRYFFGLPFAAIPCALTFDHGNENGDATNSPQNSDATNSPQNSDATNSPQNGDAKELKRRRVWSNREGTRKVDQ